MILSFKSLKQLFWFAVGIVCAVGLFQLTSTFSPLQAWMTPSATTQVLIGNSTEPVVENVSYSEFSQSHLEANYYQNS